MPKLPINYANTQIYRFVCNDVNITNTYVGSTTNWSHRKASHKSACNNSNVKRYHLNVYQVICANGGWDNWNMVLVEDFPCNGKREAEQREQYWKEQYNDDMGTYRAFRTEEQRAEQKAEQRVEYWAAYRATHKEQRAEYWAAYNATHKDQIADYRATNKGQIAERCAAYRATHKEQIVERSAAYRATHKEQKAQYRATNREQIAEQKAQYYATNRDQINLKRRQACALKKLKV
jgi:hypothetical protein